ncbi:sulfatase/phosphatase domain-containing protein [Flagellimonas maritima]|uniref:sulfatase/phosphatase domain-containing protein n=1 Tax=Flagellimonas maritima TaxID=1383885 RepID=UPI003AB04690
MRTKNWKYIQYTEGDIPAELYNLEKDPEETHNLINEAGSKVHVDRLQQLINGFLSKGE